MPKPANDQPDEMDKQIIEDMKAEGKSDEIIDEYEKGKKPDKDEKKKDEEEEEEESEEDDSESEDEEEEADDDSEEEPESEEEGKETEPESDDEEEGEEPPQKRERPVPTWAMVKKLQKDVLDLKSELAKAPETEVEKELAEFAKKYKSDPKALAELASILGKRAGLSPDDKKLLEQAKQKALDDTERDMHQKEVAKTLKHFPELRGNKDAVKKLENLAYTIKYKNTPLIEVFLENKEKILGTKGDRGTRTGEPSRGGSQKGQVKDLKKLAEEERWSEMTDEEFTKVSDELASKHRNRIFVPSTGETRT